MKKNAKIIAAIIFFALAVCLGVVVASASDAPDFKVGTETTDSWTEAVELAAGKETIYLNDDISVSSSFDISSDVRFDLNGHTITDTRDNASVPNYSTLFAIKNTSVAFELLGEGSLKNVSNVIGGSTASKVTVAASGDGITIERAGTGNSSTLASVFCVTKNSDWFVTGKITVVPSGICTLVFSLDAGESAANTVDLNISDAEITVEAPATNKYVHSTAAGQWFMSFKKYGNVTIDNSYIDVKHGNAFKFSYSSGNYTVAKDSTTYDVTTTTINEGDLIPHDSWLTVNNTTVLARNGGYSRAYAYSGIGTTLSLGSSAAEVRFTNSTLTGAARSIATTDNKSTNNMHPSNIYFKNVNYYGDPGTLYGSPWVVAYNVNIDWDGGAIHTVQNNSSAAANLIGFITLDQYKKAYLEKKGTAYTGDMSSLYTVDDLFGEIARLAASYEMASTDREGKAITTVPFAITDAMMNDSGVIASYDSWNKQLRYARMATSDGPLHERTHEYVELDVLDANGSSTGNKLALG